MRRILAALLFVPLIAWGQMWPQPGPGHAAYGGGGGGGITNVGSWQNDVRASPLDISVSGISAGDTIICWVQSDTDSATETFTWPSGFTQIGFTNISGPNGQYQAAALKPSASGSESTLTITSGFGSLMTGACAAFSGVYNSGTAADAQDFTLQSDTLTSATASPWALATTTAQTPAHAGAMIIGIMTDDLTTAGTYPGSMPVNVFTTTSGSTGSWTVMQTVNQANGWVSGSIGYAPYTSGAIGITGTGTLASHSAGEILFTMALRPQ